MPNDAKLGLIVGMTLVVTVAVVFFRKDSFAALPPKEDKTIIAVPAATSSPAAAPRGQFRTVPAKQANRTEETQNPVGRRHVVEEGDTLFSLAVRYYGDANKFVLIYRVNREVLTAPDNLAPGTVLTIPEVAKPVERANEERDR